METAGTRSIDGEGLYSTATRAWHRAVSDFYHPPLPEPEIENTRGVSSFFYIDSSSWTMHLNLAGIPPHMSAEEAVAYLTSICHHEIQHYLLCPYDGVMNGRMFAAAHKHVSDAAAMFVCNLFADFVVDSNLLRRFPSLTHSRINSSIHDSAMRMQDHSELWKLIVTCYRIMWGFPIPPTIDITQQTFGAASEIIRVARDTIELEHRWPSSCEKIAQILSKWMPDYETSLWAYSGTSNEVRQEGIDGSSIIVVVPLDIDGIMGNPIETRNGDLARNCMEKTNPSSPEEQMERLAFRVEHLDGNIEDLQSVFLMAGVGPKRADWTRFWYRAKAQRMIQFEVDSSKSSGSVPLSPEIWRLGDALEELDIVQSLQAFPVLIPNRSTRKWQHNVTTSSKISKLPPDMLIVMDSSGSMTWAMRPHAISGDYHTALVAAFAAMDFAFRKGCRVAAINFSDGVQTCDWSRERASVERVLLTYQGGGTVAPVGKISEICGRADGESIILLITDAEVSNWKQMVGAVESLSKRGHRLFLFHIGAGTGSRSSKIHQALAKAGASIYAIKSAKNLPGLVVKEVRNVYRV